MIDSALQEEAMEEAHAPPAIPKPGFFATRLVHRRLTWVLAAAWVLVISGTLYTGLVYHPDYKSPRGAEAKAKSSRYSACPRVKPMGSSLAITR